MDVMGQDTTETADPNLAASVNRQIGQTNSAVAGGYSGGMAQARGLISAPDSFNRSTSYGDPAMSAAIKARSNQQYGLQENELRVSIAKNADADHLRTLQVASQAAGQEVELNRQKSLLRWKIDQSNKRARGAVLGSVLGIVGTVAGAVGGAYVSAGTGTAAGAAAGGAAGHALGEGIGNMYGSSN